MQHRGASDPFAVPDEPVRSGFHMRFSPRSPRDRLLAKWIASDTQSGRVNISEVLKDLLYAWYMQRYAGDGNLPAPLFPGVQALPAGGNGNHEEREDPNDPLVQSLLGLGFDNI